MEKNELDAKELDYLKQLVRLSVIGHEMGEDEAYLGTMKLTEALGMLKSYCIGFLITMEALEPFIAGFTDEDMKKYCYEIIEGKE